MTPGQAPVDPLVIREPHPPAQLPLWVIPHHQISVVRRGGLKLGYRHDGHWQEGRLRAGDIVIEPAGTEVAWRWDQPFDCVDVFPERNGADAVLTRAATRRRHAVSWSGVEAATRPGRSDTEIVGVFLSPGLVNQVLEDLDGEVADRQLRAGFALRCPAIEHLAALLADEDRTALGSSMMSNSLILALVLAVIRSTADAGRPRLERRYELAPFRLRRALAFVEEHLDQHCGLDEIAAAAGLNRYHFARAFRRETGMPPCRFVMARRVERAKALLVETNRPLAAVAVSCGFSSQSHMTVAFRRFVGTTPGRWRRIACA